MDRQQNRVSDQQKTELHMEVWLIMKVKRLKRTVLSTTVAELYSFMKCFGSCQFVERLWMDLSSDVADIHKRTGVKNLVTTARTIH